MGKIYKMPFTWDFVDNEILLYENPTNEAEVKELINKALDDALDDFVDEAKSSMDIKLEGSDLLYKLIVNGSENGEINIPKDRFLKSTSYDSENKELIFVMETADGETTTRVSMTDLVASIEEKNAAQDTALEAKADKSELEPLAKAAEVTSEIAAAVEPLATKEEVSALETKVDAIVVPDVSGFAVKSDVDAALELKADKTELEPLAVKSEVTSEIAAAVEPLASKEEVAQVDAKFADKADKTELEPLATKDELAQLDEKKVEWVESTAGRKHIVLANHDSILGTSTDGGTYNVAMVSKWDVADFGSAQLHLNLNSKDGVATINDNENIATEKFVGDSVSSAVDGLAKASDVTTEIAAAIAPLAVKAEVADEIASAVEPLATKQEVSAVDEKVDAIVIPDVSGFAVKADVDAALEAKADKTELEPLAVKSDVTSEIASAVEPLATKQEVSAVDAKVDAIVIPDVSGFAVKADVDAALELKADKSELEPLAKASDVTAEIAEAIAPLAVKTEVSDEIANAVEPLATKEEVANKVDWTESTPGRKHIVLANHDSLLGTATDGNTYNVAMVSKWDVADFGSAQLHLNLNTSDEVTINDNFPIATQKWVGEQGFLTEHQDISELATKDEMQEAAANAVAQVVANAPEDFDTLKEVADYIASDKTKASEIETKLSQHDAAFEAINAKDEAQDAALEVKADKTELEPLATKAEVQALETALNEEAQRATSVEGELQGKDVELQANIDALDAKVDALEIPSIEGLAVKTEVTEEINSAVDGLNQALADKADADNVYTKSESDDKFQPTGDYVPVEDYNELVRKFAALENYVNIFIKDREEKMDEIINNMDADNNSVIIETPMESIVVPETTVAYTITAPLADNSTVELTSPKYMTLFNTSEEPVSTSIGHTFVEGETTSATSVYLVGEFDTLTLENVSPAVKSGYDAASVNNVVITENNVKNLTLALDIQDGATITNNSNANITIQDKNNTATTLTIVAPNSTVTLNGSTYEVVNATVSDNTLVIKKNVAHIDNLNVSKGNVIVEVPRQSLIAEKIGEYTIADGYTIDYLHDEIDSTNVANLAKEGTHTLVDDVTRSGNFSVGVLASDDIIWDLNGHSITSSNTRGYGIFRLRGSAHLEINDSVGTGIVKNMDDDYGLWTGTVDSKVVINGGHFEASTHVLYAEKGTIEVNGGSFRLTNEDTADKDEFGNFKFLVNCHDADYTSGEAKIIIRGGKFYGWNPSASYGEPGGPVSFVAEGYGVVESVEMIDGVEHKVFEVKPINE